MQNPNNLNVYKEAYNFALSIYKIKFPEEEKYGLTSQIRRAGVSISLNIAEGCGRGTKKELKRFLFIAFGSAKEVETLINLAKDLDYINIGIYTKINGDIETISKMLNKLIQSIKV